MVSLFFLAAMQGVNRDLYKAACVDGAGRWYRIRRITLPQIMPVSVSMALLSAIWILTQGGPRSGTTTLIVDTYKTAIGNFKFGEGAARAAIIVATTMADRIVVLNKSRIEQFGTLMKLYHHPATKFVATFIGHPNMNLLPSTVTNIIGGLTVEFATGLKLTLLVDASSARPGDKVDVGIRPQNATLGDGLSMTVWVRKRLGGVAITHGLLQDGTRFCASLPGDAPVCEGEVISIAVPLPIAMCSRPMAVS